MSPDVKKALSIAYRYGQIDGSHHRLWVIDQMVRALLGCKFDHAWNHCISESENYKQFVNSYENEECAVGDYTWETGIAP